jgi:hypothetical protein
VEISSQTEIQVQYALPDPAEDDPLLIPLLSSLKQPRDVCEISLQPSTALQIYLQPSTFTPISTSSTPIERSVYRVKVDLVETI